MSETFESEILTSSLETSAALNSVHRKESGGREDTRLVTFLIESTLQVAVKKGRFDGHASGAGGPAYDTAVSQDD